MDIAALVILAAFFLVPFLLVAASPGIVTYVTTNTTLPMLIGIFAVTSLGQPVNPMTFLIWPSLGAMLAGWFIGAGWWVIRRHPADAPPRSPLKVAIRSTTGYASAAAMTTLLTLPLWQPVVVGLLR